MQLAKVSFSFFALVKKISTLFCEIYEFGVNFQKFFKKGLIFSHFYIKIRRSN